MVHYKQNRYEVPKGSYRPGRQALIEPDLETGKLRLSDIETGELLAEHNLLFGTRGKKVSLPRNAERYRETKFDDLKTIILEHFSGNTQISGFLDRIHADYARYTRGQYGIILKALKTYNREELANALNYCVEHDLYSASYFRETLLYFRGLQLPAKTQQRLALPDKYENVRVQERSFDAYETLLKGGAAQ
jgi:hypothetical protein